MPTWMTLTPRPPSCRTATLSRLSRTRSGSFSVLRVDGDTAGTDDAQSSQPPLRYFRPSSSLRRAQRCPPRQGAVQIPIPLRPACIKSSAGGTGGRSSEWDALSWPEFDVAVWLMQFHQNGEMVRDVKLNPRDEGGKIEPMYFEGVSSVGDAVLPPVAVKGGGFGGGGRGSDTSRGFRPARRPPFNAGGGVGGTAGKLGGAKGISATILFVVVVSP